MSPDNLDLWEEVKILQENLKNAREELRMAKGRADDRKNELLHKRTHSMKLTQENVRLMAENQKLKVLLGEKTLEEKAYDEELTGGGQ